MLSSVKGSSSWLTTLENEFCLHKGAFQVALCPIYGCNHHCCLPAVHAGLWTEICHSVEIEPSLQPLSGESFQYRSANIDDGTSLDVAANGFWERGQNAYFDVKVFNPFAPTHWSVSSHQCYQELIIVGRENILCSIGCVKI